MAISFVAFDLQDGFVQNWLSAGPQEIPLSNSADLLTHNGLRQAALQFYQQNSGITHTPVEPGPLEKSRFRVGEYQGEWAYYRCREDHFVDFSTSIPQPAFLRSWAYTQLVSTQAQSGSFTVDTYGPIDIWVNKSLAFHSETFSEAAASYTFSAGLVKGANKITVRFAGITTPECKLAFRLHIQDEGIKVRIPSLIPSIERRNELEAINEQLFFDRDIYTGSQRVCLLWPEGVEKVTYQDARLLNREGFIYGQAEDIGKPGSTLTFSLNNTLDEGPYRGYVMPRAWEFYESQIRITKTLPIWLMGRNSFSNSPYGTPEERRQEALANATRRGGDIFAEVAKMALGMWARIDQKVIDSALKSITERHYGSETALLALLGIQARFAEQSEYPQALGEQIRAAALQYHYDPAPSSHGVDGFGEEDRQFILSTCELLAGQMYPEQIFASSGLTGTEHCKQAEERALAWIQEHGRNGFGAWDAKNGYANVLMALSYLVDKAQAEAVFEMASVLIDKLLYSVAVNSYKGIFGSTQGQATTESIKSGLQEATSGITRLLWGMGVFNYHIAGTVSFALMQDYELPLILAEIAAGDPEELLNREQQRSGEQIVNKVTYRTPDFMLSSAQDYRPGEPGSREHIWQATFGPQCVVFSNHPGNSSESDSHTPNYWLGNGALPRVAQWKDTLIALYQIPDDAALGYTHAYFPTYEFDEYVLRGSTAFARKGDAYIALTTAQGLDLLVSGPTANRELRSVGQRNAWVCQMGRNATDGSFEAFQDKVLAHPITFDGLQVKSQTLRGETLQFAWEGPLLVNGEEQALRGYKHFENPYTTADLPASEIEIRTENYLLKLDFQN